MFCITDPDISVYDMARHPFVMLAQYLEAKKLVLVPLWALHQLSEEAGDPPKDCEIIGIGMSARSGSTLLTQMFNKLPDTIAMSEPWSLLHAHKWYNKGYFPKKDYPTLIRALLRLQFKKIHNVS